MLTGDEQVVTLLGGEAGGGAQDLEFHISRKPVLRFGQYYCRVWFASEYFQERYLSTVE